MRLYIIGITAALGLTSLVSSPLFAQNQNKSRRSNNQKTALEWSVDAMMEQNVSAMTRMYNLSPTQEKYTRELLKSRAKRFLNDYEGDLRWAFYEYFDYTSKGEIPPIEIFEAWGERGLPLLRAARKEILEGNMKWRDILTAEQKRKHDRDLEQLTNFFDQWDDKLQRWSKGDLKEGDFPGVLSPGANRAQVRESEEAWAFFVRKFIQDYNLDEGQRASAYSQLNQLRRQARDYRQSKETEFDRLKNREQQLMEASPAENPDDLKKRQESFRELRKERIRLEEYISKDLFNKLKSELMKIPTVDQKRTFDERMAKLKRIAEGGVDSRPASSPAEEAPPVVEEKPAELTAATKPE